ncbi:hypothetical protein INT43_004448 [Umbelopsis isabellina]|uniref:Sister chromatid cohesion protein n=1 Tax=Mortierella isabellina TaxID=91625 RepID=A0A8H7U997_MORIS|nr:hypothetical protein INT43_004448 [Umbelopsis isabellina]
MQSIFQRINFLTGLNVALSWIPPVTLDRQEQSYTTEPHYNELKISLHQGQPQSTKLNDFHKQLFELRAKIEDKPLSSFYNEQNEVGENEADLVNKNVKYSESQDFRLSNSISDHKHIEYITEQDESMVEDQLVFAVVDDEQMPDVITRNSQDQHDMESETQNLGVAANPNTNLSDMALAPAVAPMDIDQTFEVTVEGKETAEKYTELTNSNDNPEVGQHEDDHGTIKPAQLAIPTEKTAPEEVVTNTCSSDSALDRHTLNNVNSMLNHEQVVDESAIYSDATMKYTAFENVENHESDDYNHMRAISEVVDNPNAAENVLQEALLTETDNAIQSEEVQLDAASGLDNCTNDELQDSSLKHSLVSDFEQDVQEQVHDDPRSNHLANPDSSLPNDSKTVMTWSEEKDVVLSNLRHFIQALLHLENQMLLPTNMETDRGVGLNVGLSDADKGLFIVENQQLLLSPTTTRRIAALVRKANKYNQLKNVDDEELSWVLKKLEQNVRKGLLEIQDERRSSQESYGTPQLGGLDMLNIDRGADGAFTIFSILISTQLDKKLYAEEVIKSCLQFIKSLVNDIVSPLFETWNSTGKIRQRICDHILNIQFDTIALPAVYQQQGVAEFSQYSRRLQWIKSISLQAARIINQLCRFVQQEDISDDMVITICYISIPPFFLHSEHTIETSETFSMHQAHNSERPIVAIKVSSLDLLRCIFAKYAKHRNWILEEILANVVHMSSESEKENSYRTSGGHTVHVISALIFQLAQCSADSQRTKERSWTQKWELKNQRRIKGAPKLDASFINKVLATSAAGIEACTQTLHIFMVQLLKKSLKSPSQTNTTLEYRRILDVFISDAMKILNEPEWPVAETIIRMFSTVLMESLDNDTSDMSQRTLAIEYLGLIAGRIFRPIIETSVVSDSLNESMTMEDVHAITSIIEKDSLQNLNQLHTSQENHLVILEYLRNQITLDNIAQSALRYNILQWEYANASAWKSITESNQEENQELENRQSTLDALNSHIKQLWDILLDNNISDTLQDKSYQAMILRIFASLDSESVSQRSAALRALLNLSAKDISFMQKNHVHHSIIRRMQDTSPSVRDSAIKLAGNYLASHTEGTQQYYTAISERILDTSISVRKRVIRILRDIYLHTNIFSMHVDIGAKVIDRMIDDITAVRESALKASMETIFAPWTSPCIQRRNLEQTEFQYLPHDFKKEKAKVTVQASNAYCSWYAVDISDEKRLANINSMLKLIIDSLFSMLLQFEDAGDNSSVTNCIGLIHCFAKSSPHLFKRTLMTMLEPYLKSSNGTDNKALYYAIKIHDAVLPVMKRPDPLFLADTQLTLTKLLVDCPVLLLPQVTKSPKLGKLREEKGSVLNSGPVSSAQRLIRLCLITGLLCQYCDFDRKPELKDKSGRLLKLCQNGIAHETFDLLYFFAANRVTGDNISSQVSNQIKLAALQSLGYLYIQYPKFMVTKKSTTMMDEMFASRFNDYKSRVLHVFLDYLAGEEKRITEREKESSKSTSEVDVHKLLGDASEMAELRQVVILYVSSSLMQRYLDRILHTALDPNEQLRTLSFKVIVQIVQQGLAHPVICMPVIVALETSPDQLMRDKAYQLHNQLHQRHQGLLYSRNIACVETAYDYNARQLGKGSVVSGHLEEIFEYEALLQPMYSLLRDKRKARNDFLSSIVKLFDIDFSESTDKDIYFFRFIAHNLIGMRYKFVEELLCIIFAINKVLSTTAMNIMSALSIEDEIQDLDFATTSHSDRSRRTKRRNELKLATEGVLELDESLTVKYCLIMSLLLLIKHVLKQTYNLTEEKCQQYHPEESNSYKSKAVAQQSAVVAFNQSLLQFPIFDTETNSDVLRELACKHFAKLMMDDSLGTSNTENDKPNRTNQLDHQSSDDNQAEDDTQNRDDSIDLIDIIKRRN